MSGQGLILIVSDDDGKLSAISERIASLLDWAVGILTPGLAIATEPGVPILRSPRSDSSWMIGTVFHRYGPGPSVAEMDAPLAAILSDGDLATLLQRYWGSYLAIIRAKSGYRILRDPSASMPCYYCGDQSHLCLTNNVPSLVKAGLLQPRIAWGSLAETLYRAGLPIRTTAIDQVAELLPGEELHLSANGINTHGRWSPWDHVTVNDAIGAEEQAERLRRIVDTCVGNWAKQFDHPLVTLSGGLDSSVVAACASKAAKRVTGITLWSDDRNGDERRFARLVGTHLSMPLIEAEYDMKEMAPERSAYARSPRPIGRSPAVAYDAALARAIEATGADSVFTGNGGDNVFAHSQSASAIADHMLHKGLSLHLWPIVRNVCLLTGCSLFEALAAARRIARGDRRYHWQPDRRLLAADYVRELDAKPLTHAWLSAPADALPGKAAHVAALLRIQIHLDGVKRFGATTVVDPLMSQPIVEACLGIPSWFWCHAGRDRAIARLAFVGRLPNSITSRRSKGGPDGFGMRFLSQFRRRIAQRLLDGELARRRLVDRPAIEAALFNEKPDAGPEQVRLLELIDAEAWIEHWNRLPGQTQA